MLEIEIPEDVEHYPLPNRLDLMQKLSTGLDTEHCLVHGGPGFGKTTLLRQYADLHAGPVYFLDMHENGDLSDSLIRVLTDIANTNGGQVGAIPFAAHSWSTMASGKQRPEQLIDRLSESQYSASVLIVDNFDVYQLEEALIDLMGMLLSRLSTGLRLVISSRDLPSFPWARLEMSQSLFRIGPDDLYLTNSEIVYLLERSGLGTQLAESVRELSGGWPLGVTHCIRLLQSSTDILVQDLPVLLADDLLFHQYFKQEIFDIQEEAIQQFMVKTSLLPSFSELDLDELLGVEREPVDLGMMRNVGGLVGRSPGRHSSNEYAVLLRIFLNTMANTLLSRKELEELSFRAAQICESYGMIDEARRNYVVAGAFQTAAELLERVADDYLEAYMLEVVRNWTSEIPDNVRINRPWILAYQGKSIRRLGKNTTGMVLLESALELFERQDDHYGIAFTSYELALALYILGRFKDANTVTQRAIGLVGDDPALTGRLYITLCLSYGALDDYQASLKAGLKSLEELAKVTTSSVRPLLESRIRQFLARTYARMGKSGLARRQAERSLELCDEYDLGSFKRVWSLHALAMSLWVAGERKAAFTHLAQADECGQSDNPQQRLELNMIRGNLYLEEGDPVEAERSFLLCGKNGLHFLALSNLMQGKLELAENQIARALRTFESGESPSVYATTLVIAARIDAEAGRIVSAISRIERAISLFHGHQGWLALASAWFQLGLTYHAALDTENSMMAWKKSLEIARTNKLRHLLWTNAEALIIVMEVPGLARRDRDFLFQMLKLEAAQGSVEITRALSKWKDPMAYKLFEVTQSSLGSGLTGIETILSDCTDSDLRTRLQKMLALGEVEPSYLIKLRTFFELTWREIEVYYRYVNPRTSLNRSEEREKRSEVAADLNMSENTLKVHATNVRRKLKSPGND